MQRTYHVSGSPVGVSGAGSSVLGSSAFAVFLNWVHTDAGVGAAPLPVQERVHVLGLQRDRCAAAAHPTAALLLQLLPRMLLPALC